MELIKMIYVYLIAVPIFFAIDLVWLGLVAKNLYQSQLGHLLGPVNWSAAIIFYLIFILGIVIFAIAPALEKQSLMYALIYGALFGFFTYATYDLTNLATLKDWPILIVIVDMIWGTVLSASVAVGTYYIAMRFLM